MNSSVEIDQDTFQDLVKFYGETFNLPPLAAKIYAYLIFDFDKKGICFEEFVEILSASKSSVSANLNLLLNANLITDFNKIDERKRFFLINENYIVLRFEEIIEKMKREIQILDKLNDFRKTKSADTNPRFEIYKSLLNNNIVNIQDTLLKL
ncbi:transcriptional regulator [Chryseobacterium sp.]|uniref:transcriptional regulator n=1 Tax=Chryseobacterium sp. TaxID=1871047 RepID=UPI0011C89179|nr:transcriptional regulator [Chryseobacterium sp.]TXF79503.1 transcriptional regulator [Chryseobacterium sp.]